jgi:hypothetical protein
MTLTILAGGDAAVMATLEATRAALVENNSELASECLNDLSKLFTTKMTQQVFKLSPCHRSS